MAFVML